MKRLKKEFKWSKYKKLFKTEKAVAVFIEQRKDELEDWEFILKNYHTPKKGWKDLADRMFSIYIRLKNMDKHGRCRCVTCGRVEHWKYMQNGHYRSRLCNKYRFDERNCHPQCKGCNMVNGGNYRNYHIYMVKRYGEKIEDMIWNDKEKVEHKQGWYEENIMEWWKFIKGVLYGSKIKSKDE